MQNDCETRSEFIAQIVKVKYEAYPILINFTKLINMLGIARKSWHWRILKVVTRLPLKLEVKSKEPKRKIFFQDSYHFELYAYLARRIIERRQSAGKKQLQSAADIALIRHSK